MSDCHDFIQRNVSLPKWPYPICYGEEEEIHGDVLILGGGIAGCWAAISAAKKGAKVMLVEKGATIRSGSGGSGCDHWDYTPNPCSKITAEDMVEEHVVSNGGYTNGISHYIACRESYDTLLELEKMGGKIRDTEDEFKGAEFRDEKTKFLFATDYINRLHFRVWGTTFKPALYKECKRLGVKILDRIQATSLLTEGGKQGDKVIGATGLNVRTGGFYIFKAKATVLCVGRPQRIWVFQTELTGLNTLRPQTVIGNGCAMAWRSGAAFLEMERSRPDITAGGWPFPQLGVGCAESTWFACRMVDASGKEIPFVDVNGKILKTISERYRPASEQKHLGERSTAYAYRKPLMIPDLFDRIRNGEFKLPLYADLPGMPEIERKVIWELMIAEEGNGKVPVVQNYTEAGFDPNKDLLQSYAMMGGDTYTEYGRGGPRQRLPIEGGVQVDWDLMTTLEGLYAAGDQLFGGNFHHHAAATGRYAGRKAADYAMKTLEPVAERGQIDAEKIRVYAPLKRKEGIEWKELNAGICQVMQNYCGDPKNGELLNIGLIWLKDIEKNEASQAYATNPHKLGRTIDVLDILTNSQIIINACLARKASSNYLNFNRLDYPKVDPPEWNKWLPIRLENGGVKVSELPINFWGNPTENYENHNKDYVGWHNTRNKGELL